MTQLAELERASLPELHAALERAESELRRLTLMHTAIFLRLMEFEDARKDDVVARKRAAIHLFDKGGRA